MLHMLKMAAGVHDIGQLRARQASQGGTPVHTTRNLPKRADEITDGGSIYWVFGGAVSARQRVVDIRQAAYGDGTKCAVLVLDPEIVAVEGRPTKAFQGWRYLEAEAASPDVSARGAVDGIEEMPERMRRELRALMLI